MPLGGIRDMEVKARKSINSPAAAPGSKAGVRSGIGCLHTGQSLSERSVKVFLPGFTRVSGLVVAGLGMVELLGWIFHLQPLMRIFEKPAAMNPVAAICFIFLGSALHFSAREPLAGFLWRTAHLLLAVPPLLAGLLKISDHLMGLHFNFDQLLFPAQLNGFTPANQIAPNTAIAFVLCGAAMLLIDVETRRGFRPAQALMLAAGILAIIALVGYAYQVSSLYRVGTAIPMSLTACLGLGLFTLGFFAARPDRGLMLVVMSPTTGGAIARRLIPMAILIPWALGAVLLTGEQSGYYERQFGVSIFAVLSIIIFTLLIWWNAKLLYLADLERERTEKRLDAQHSATRLLTESITPDELIPRLMASIGETVGWPSGNLWMPHPKDETLRCTHSWHSDDLKEFAELTKQFAFHKGQGLPGRVWLSRETAWIADVSMDPNFPRAEAAARAGLSGAVAFPIPLGEGAIGVMEFFSRCIEPRDEQLIEMLNGLGTHIGDSLERRKAEEQLRRASENLKRSNTDLQQFAYVASHDLFEPLRMIISYLQLLSRKYQGKLDSEADEFINFAVDGARRMEALIHDLLAYSRLDASPRPFELTDCNQVLNTVLTNLKVAIQERNAIIECEPLPIVIGDRVQIAQVFQNLIGNAIKFNKDEDGPPKIQIAARQVNREWVFSVKDNGIGISPKDFERIFVIFQRLHTRQEYAGTGIGLAVCKRILERHGGRMWVESSPGQGSTFYFSLPAHNGKDAAGPVQKL